MLLPVASATILLSIFGFGTDHLDAFLVLTFINIPTYWWAAIQYFGSEDDANDCINSVGSHHWDNASTDEQWDNLKGLGYFVICATIITAQYKFLAWLFF